MATIPLTADMERQLLEELARFRAKELHAIHELFTKMAALGLESPLINNWLARAGDPNLEDILPEIASGAQLPYYTFLMGGGKAKILGMLQMFQRELVPQQNQRPAAVKARNQIRGQVHGRKTRTNRSNRSPIPSPPPNPNLSPTGTPPPTNSRTGGPSPPTNSPTHNHSPIPSPNHDPPPNPNLSPTGAPPPTNSSTGGLHRPTSPTGTPPHNPNLSPPSSSPPNPTNSPARSPAPEPEESDAESDPNPINSPARSPTPEPEESDAESDQDSKKDILEPNTMEFNFPVANLVAGVFKRFTTEQYCCMLMNQAIFEFPLHHDELQVGIVYRADGRHRQADNSTWLRPTKRISYQMNGMELHERKYEQRGGNWTKMTMEIDGDDAMIIHYMLPASKVVNRGTLYKCCQEVCLLREKIEKLRNDFEEL